METRQRNSRYWPKALDRGAAQPAGVTGRLSGRVALVTGASRGIGAAVATRFAKEGAHVVAVARTVGGLEELDDAIKAVGGSSTLVPLDLLEFDGIDRLAGAVHERWSRLDILVGNAAMLGQLSPMGHYPPDMWAKVMDLNLNANWRLIRAFDVLLRESDAGRALFVTSGVARAPHAYWGPYAASKAALENLVRTWAAELEKTNVRVNVIDPGRVRTLMRAQAYPGEDPETLPLPEDVCGTFVEIASPDYTGNGKIVQAA